jgi:hypothetical protein
VSTPTLQQARSHYERQRRIAAAALVAVRKLFKRRASLLEVASTVASYQLASAMASVNTVAAYAGDTSPLTVPAAFAGVSSRGFPISEPIIATIDQYVPAPVEPLPDNWWDDATAFMAQVEQLIVSEVQDAGRTASQVEFVSRPDWTNYVRMLNPPSCPRCTILAGRIYRDLEEFARHPGCDCVMVPVTDWESAHDASFVSTPQEAFDKGHVRGLSKADEQAIRDGADITTVVNASQGMVKVTAFGQRVKATTYGTTRRAAWRKANPTRLVRLRPESIYEFAKDRDDAIRLLTLYGYIR